MSTKPLSDIEVQIMREKKNNFCLIHPKEELKAFCKTDFMAICFRCHLEKHKSHDVVMLEDINTADLKVKISEFETDLQDQCSKVDYLFDKISTSKDNYDEQHTILLKTFEEILHQQDGRNRIKKTIADELLKMRKGESLLSNKHPQGTLDNF